MHFKTHLFIVTVVLFSFLLLPLSGADLLNMATAGIAEQSTQLGAYSADLAIDNNLGNFTHTQGAEADAWWELELDDSYDISEIIIHNRTSCCGSRLRDITVFILDEKDGDIIYESELLNIENELGVFPLGPGSIIIDLVLEEGNPITGQIVRITRTSDPDLSGSTGQGNADEANVLSLGEVEVLVALQSEIPIFTQQPDAARAYVGQNVEFTVEAAVGTGDITYQWLKEGVEIAGATETTLLLDFIQMDAAGEYTVTATANGNSITSKPAVLVVPGINLSLWGTATQSSDYNAIYIAGLGNDGITNNYTHTAAGQANASWEIDLNDLKDIESIVIWNRTDCCGSRLRDITVKIIDDIDGDVIYESDLLNEANENYVYPNGPEKLIIDLVEETGEAVQGRIVRIERTSDPENVGVGGQGNTAEADVLSLAEVEIFTSGSIECPEEGDTYIEDISYESFVDGQPGEYTITIFGSDDSDDSPLFYTFSATKQGADTPMFTAGPQTEDFTIFNLTIGTWIITGSIDDDLICRDTTAEATQTIEIEIMGDPDNLAWRGVQTQSTTCWNDPADFAVDMNPASFSHTCGDDDNSWWEVDFGETADIDAVTIQNRTGYLSRLRDITIIIMDSEREVAYISELLNEENDIYIFPDGPIELKVDLVEETGTPVKGQIVRIERLSDPDLSGSGGLGNTDEGNVLTLVEVEILGSISGQTGGPLFQRGDTNGDNATNLADAITILSYLFSGGDTPACMDAADTNDDGTINLADAIQLLSHLFAGTGDLPMPFGSCGEDPTSDDTLAECVYPACQ